MLADFGAGNPRYIPDCSKNNAYEDDSNFEASKFGSSNDNTNDGEHDTSTEIDIKEYWPFDLDFVSFRKCTVIICN